MRKVGDKLREFIEYLKLMQVAGYYRVGILALYVLVLFILLGFMLEYMCIGYLILVIVLDILFIIGIMWNTLSE